MVARSTAFETSEHIPREVSREGTVFSSLGRFMQGTLAPHLLAGPFENDQPQEFKYFRHGDVGPSCRKSMPDIATPAGIREEEPVISSYGMAR